MGYPGVKNSGAPIFHLMGYPGVKNSEAPDFIEDFYILSIRVIDYPGRYFI